MSLRHAEQQISFFPFVHPTFMLYFKLNSDRSSIFSFHLADFGENYFFCIFFSYES